MNKPGILLEVVQVLSDLDLTISKAYITSDGRWFMDGKTCLFKLEIFIISEDREDDCSLLYQMLIYVKFQIYGNEYDYIRARSP